MPLDINQLYRRYGSMVYRRCRQLLKDEGEAKDAMQDTFVKLIQSQATLDQEFPSSLLYRIATHVALNRIRTLQRHPEDRDEQLLYNIADGSDLEGTLIASRFLGRLFGKKEESLDQAVRVDTGLEKTIKGPTSTRVMAVMHFVDGLTLEEVADECGLSVSGVRKRLRKIKEMAVSLKTKEATEVLL
jgi:RNA polymerase sigma factor (sigma-70 family)